jgi:hypothetical protein
MAIEGRPANGSELAADGMPIPYMIFATTGRSTSYCYEIEHAGVGVTGDTKTDCLTTWLEEYEYEHKAAFQPTKQPRTQLALFA